MGGHGWKLVRFVIGLVLVAGIYILLSQQRFVRLHEEFVAQLVAGAFGGALALSGVIGMIRLARRKKSGNAPASKAATALLLLPTLIVGGALGGAVVVFARGNNVRTAEAHHWKTDRSDWDTDRYERYLDWVDGVDGTRLRTKFDPAELDRLTHAYVEANPGTPEFESLREKMDALRPVKDKFREVRRKNASWFFAKFTDIHAHVKTAETEFDDALYNQALETKRATPLRAYRARFPNGRHFDDARAALRALYAQSEADYRALVKRGGADPEAKAGVLALLKFLRESDADVLVVPVSFLPVKGLDAGGLERKLKKITGAAKVVPVSPAFTTERNERRHDVVVNRMNVALKRVVNDLFVLEDRVLEGSQSGPRFLVHYEVQPTGATYTSSSEKDLPIAKRTLYVGIGIQFDFTLQVPKKGEVMPADPSRGHRFSVFARPAPNFKTRGRTSKGALSAWTVYETMAGTAFNEFADELARGYGLGSKKI